MQAGVLNEHLRYKHGSNDLQSDKDYFERRMNLGLKESSTLHAEHRGACPRLYSLIGYYIRYISVSSGWVFVHPTISSPPVSVLGTLGPFAYRIAIPLRLLVASITFFQTQLSLHFVSISVYTVYKTG